MALSYDTSQENLLPLAVASHLNPEIKTRRRQRRFIILSLALIDGIGLFATLALAYFLRFKVFGFLYVPEGSTLRFYAELVFWIIPAWLLVFVAYRLYDLRVLHGGIAEYRRVATACTFAMIMLLACSFFLDDKLIISRAWLLMVWVMSVALIIVCRFLTRRVLYHLRQRGIAMTRVLVVGANSEAQQIAQQLASGRNLPGMELVGFVGERRQKPRLVSSLQAAQPLQRENVSSPNQWPVRWFGLVENVRKVVDEQQIDEVIIASTAIRGEELFEVVRMLTTSKVEIRLSPDVYEFLTTGLEVQEINGMPLVTVSKVRITGVNAFMKRALDIVGSSILLTILLPLFLILTFMVRRDSPGPAFYRRRVVGQGGKLFDAYKFRSMRTDGDAILAAKPALRQELEETGKLKDDPRVTRLGKFIREKSIDELPQLINVLRGQMSLVGPRMITYQEMIKFGRWQSNLTTVKPGMTGLWQISGRSDLTYEERVRLDMQYIRNYSLWTDLRILFETIPAILRGRGAY